MTNAGGVILTESDMDTIKNRGIIWRIFRDSRFNMGVLTVFLGSEKKRVVGAVRTIKGGDILPVVISYDMAKKTERNILKINNPVKKGYDIVIMSSELYRRTSK